MRSARMPWWNLVVSATSAYPQGVSQIHRRSKFPHRKDELSVPPDLSGPPNKMSSDPPFSIKRALKLSGSATPSTCGTHGRLVSRLSLPMRPGWLLDGLPFPAGAAGFLARLARPFNPKRRSRAAARSRPACLSALGTLGLLATARCKAISPVDPAAAIGPGARPLHGNPVSWPGQAHSSLISRIFDSFTYRRRLLRSSVLAMPR
jgi:hypothetical protein